MGRPKHRFKDARRAEGKSICGYIHGEGPTERHARRLRFNLNNGKVLEEWCGKRGLVLSITNEGHHWLIEGDSFMAEWWPSSAKLVINKRWNDGIHTHDVLQLMTEINKRLKGATDG